VVEFSGNASTRRRQIFLELRALATCDLMADLADHLLVNGSFVTQKPLPGDVDIVVGLKEGTRRRLLSGDLTAQADPIISKLEGRISERIDGRKTVNGFAAQPGDAKYESHLSLFQSDSREGGPQTKGILRIGIAV
jgi:hypothetical protein